MEKKIAEHSKRKTIILSYVLIFALAIILGLIKYFLGKLETEKYMFVIEITENLLIGVMSSLITIVIFDVFIKRLIKREDEILLRKEVLDIVLGKKKILREVEEKRRKEYLSTIMETLVCSKEVKEMGEYFLEKYMFNKMNRRIRLDYQHYFVLRKKLSQKWSTLFSENDYFLVEEVLSYKVKYFENNNPDEILAGLFLDNMILDQAVHNNMSDEAEFAFVEMLDIDKGIFTDNIEEIIEKIKPTVKIDGTEAKFLTHIIDKDNDNIAYFRFENPNKKPSGEYNIEIIIDLPKKWNSNLSVVFMDPTKAPRVFVDYPCDEMRLDVYTFLNNETKLVEKNMHERSRGVCDISIGSEAWIYPVSGIVFSVISFLYNSKCRQQVSQT